MAHLRIAFILCTCCLTSAAELIGPPPRLRPGPAPDVWVQWTNDFFSGEVGDNNDDHRTQAIGFGLRLAEHLFLACDHSTFTDRVAATRTDELSLTGGVVLDRHLGWFRVWGSAGAGVRSYRDWQGERIQTQWHEWWGFDPVPAMRQDPARVEGVGFASVHALFAPALLPILAAQTPADVPPAPLSNRYWGILVDAIGLAGTRGTREAQLGARGCLFSDHAGVWLGLQRDWRSAAADARTAAAVADAESDWWWTMGACAGCLFAEVALDHDTHLATGRIGFMPFRRDPLGPVPDGAERGIFEAEGGMGVAPFGVGLLLRWQPHWAREHGPWMRRLSVIVEHRWGDEAGTHPEQDRLRFMQPVTGLELAAAPVHTGFMVPLGATSSFHVLPYIRGAVGVREMTLMPAERSTAAGDRMRAAVVQGGAGIRCLWRPPASWGSVAWYGLTCGYDHWVPLRSGYYDTDHGPLAALHPDGHLQIRLVVQVPW